MGEVCLVEKNGIKRTKNRRSETKKMEKYIRKMVKMGKYTLRNSGINLDENVEILYNKDEKMGHNI